MGYGKSFQDEGLFSLHIGEKRHCSPNEKRRRAYVVRKFRTVLFRGEKVIPWKFQHVIICIIYILYYFCLYLLVKVDRDFFQNINY